MEEFSPHEVFQFDFSSLLDESKRQEKIDVHNHGEYAIALEIYKYFMNDVMPLIKQNDWVFNGVSILVTDYIDAYFKRIRLAGKQAYDHQMYLQKLKEEVSAFLKKHASTRLAGDSLDLIKMSDFVSVIELESLSRKKYVEAIDLYERVKDHEEIQLNILLQNIGDAYEMGFPRIMFVIRLVMKVSQGLHPKDSDNYLFQPSDYIQWYKDHLIIQHPLQSLLTNLKLIEFYKVARNVANHHLGLNWQPESNLIILQDKKRKLKVNVREFHQNYRCLIYLCDYGLRGVFSAFCERDRSEISNQLFLQYNKTYPKNFPHDKEGLIKFYT